MRNAIVVFLLVAVAATAACTRKAAHVFESPFFDPDPNAKPPPKREPGDSGGY